ncbi:very short patch repair endonuclease [Paracandidimonas lactea]|uniref:very short patch repair endonuclease n=1 Tax=Paracandidimonas lactea TaxID=2895524 RepID=UPI001F1BF9B2|nr:very short patch repair endonuclease [Paracandidimonas lactea]
MDTFTPSQRSALMSRIRHRDTKPEVTVRSLLHALGYRFRLHRKDLPGKPDIVLPKYRKIVMVHGCFWHGHSCRRASKPKSNQEYWIPKIAANRQRDARNVAELKRLGWSVLVLWECEIKDISAIDQRLREFLGPKR